MLTCTSDYEGANAPDLTCGIITFSWQEVQPSALAAPPRLAAISLSLRELDEPFVFPYC